ncbi:MAG: hypothetical protein SFV15_25345 [Polyangiaceae bacterium]|nr:hypothetical protein [Polyangiaceae bacterium]
MATLRTLDHPCGALPLLLLGLYALGCQPAVPVKAAAQPAPSDTAAAAQVVVDVEPAAEPPTNLLRNGSFEGSGRYWNGATEAMLDTTNPAFGRYALKLSRDPTPEEKRPKGQGPRTTTDIRSGAFYLERDREVTVSLSIRADEKQEVKVWLFPANRQTAQNLKLVWDDNAAKRFEAGPEWKRVSFKAKYNIGLEKWFKSHAFMLSISAGNTWVDGVTVSYTKGDASYEPRAKVEVAADALDMPGYLSEAANLSEPGSQVKVRGAVHNPGTQPRKVRLAWQLYDYTGEKAYASPVTKELTLAPGATEIQTVPMTLSAKGLTLARVSAFDEGGNRLDKSDFPFTVLAYPQANTTQDPSERFGIGVRGPHTLRLAQKIGFRWTRWYTDVDWENVQRKGPKESTWPDKQLKEIEERGILPIFVLFRIPDWAKDKDEDSLPKDMKWGVNDPRWDDLTIKTWFDQHVERAVTRYKDKAYVWELSNEPDLDVALPPDIHYRLAVRTSRIIKRIKPDAIFMVNSTLGRQTDFFQRFFELGGARDIDVYTWHDYQPAKIGDGDKIRHLRQMIDAYGPNKAQIWFDEGFTFVNSATDDAAPAVTQSTSREVANWMVTNWVEMLAAGLEKCVVFHIGYEHQGRSFWDYTGAGTELWDTEQLPTVGVSMWNTIIQHLGRSTPKGSFRPLGATVHVFDDLRNQRGVMIAWSKEKRTLKLPIKDLILEDVTGNAWPAPTEAGVSIVTLNEGEQPLYLYTKDKQSAQRLADALKGMKP